MYLGGSIVIGIASTSEQRVRLAGLVDEESALVLVSSTAAARSFLDRQLAAPSPPEPRRGRGAPHSAQEQHQHLSALGLRVDSDRHVATYAGREISLTPLEHDLLRCLVREPGRIWSFDRIHEAVWGTHHVGAGANVHSVVKRLRRKLRQVGSPVGIDAIRGVGFRLSVPDDAPHASVRGLSAVD